MDESKVPWLAGIADATQAAWATFLVYSGAIIDFLDKHAGAIVVVFAAVLTVSTIRLWRASVRLFASGEDQIAVARKAAESAGASAATAAAALEHARQTAEREQRAYVNVDLCDVVGFRMEPGIRPMVRAILKNSGKTPAYDLVMHLDVAAAPPRPESWPQPQEGGESKKLPIAPGASLPWLQALPPLTPQLIEDLKADRMRFHVFGMITYRDAFGHQRETTYRATTRGTETDANARQVLQATDGNTCT